MSNWSEEENEFVVRKYFEMLSLQFSDEDFVKADYWRSVMESTGRTKGAVEYKFQNISAILDEIGMRWVKGYVPMVAYQQSLKTSVVDYLEHMISIS